MGSYGMNTRTGQRNSVSPMDALKNGFQAVSSGSNYFDIDPDRNNQYDFDDIRSSSENMMERFNDMGRASFNTRRQSNREDAVYNNQLQMELNQQQNNLTQAMKLWELQDNDKNRESNKSIADLQTGSNERVAGIGANANIRVGELNLTGQRELAQSQRESARYTADAQRYLADSNRQSAELQSRNSLYSSIMSRPAEWRYW